jgi:hypothetical protein
MPTARQAHSPTSQRPIDDATYWLDRAEEIQTIADGMRDPHARILMLDLIETYKRLAERAYERAKHGAAT